MSEELLGQIQDWVAKYSPSYRASMKLRKLFEDYISAIRADERRVLTEGKSGKLGNGTACQWCAARSGSSFAKDGEYFCTQPLSGCPIRKAVTDE